MAEVNEGLLERERRLQVVLDAVKLHAWTLDVARQRFECPPTFFAVLGLPADSELSGRLVLRSIHPDDRRLALDALRAVLRALCDLDVQIRVVRPDGSIRWLHVQATLVAAASDIHLCGVCADITSRKSDEQQLRESGGRLKLALNAARMGTWLQDLKSQQITVDSKFRELLGFSETEPVDLPAWRRRIAAPDRDSAVNAFICAMNEHLPHDAQYRVLLPDGSVRWISSQAIIIYDGAGEPASAYGVVSDITARKADEQQRRQREREFQTLIENSPDIISRLDRALRHLYINGAVEPAFGVPPPQFIGRTMSELPVPAELIETTRRTAEAAFASLTEQSASLCLSDGNGATHYLMRAIPELDTGGIAESVLLIITDVSERTRALLERDQLLEREHAARKQAEEAARARDQFLAIVSHELRSPLNGIQNWSYVLENQLKNPPATIRRALGGIRSGIEQQVRLIDDLLDATRIMSGKLSLVMQPAPVSAIIKAAVDSVCAAAAAKNIVVETDVAAEGETVYADADRLQQIFWNLLSNAIKFTPPDGRVLLRSSREQDDLVVAVTDNGKGVSPEFMPHLFEWFRRDETESIRAQDGLGLGLALVKHLCELHGGSVSASSPGAGKGATFTVRLPLKRPSTIASTQATPQIVQQGRLGRKILAGLRVLLIDDHADTRESLAVLLEHAGAKLISMSSGESARRWIEDRSPADIPHVLICDIAMPGEDGYTTLKKIRAYEASMGVPPASRIPAIAVTAFAHREDRIRALAAGFQMHMAKPLSSEELIVVIATMSGRPLSQADYHSIPLIAEDKTVTR